MILEKEFTFDSAHFLPFAPEGHKCRRLHGHTYRVTVGIQGELDAEKGWLRDFGEIKEIVKPILDELDHRLLNAIPGLENPTAEILAKYIFDKLRARLPELTYVTVEETPTSRAIYGRDNS
ncbi:MAG: 6-carboxytetrahydropterin synthase QueD [Leptospiraceae bacterium]|nr:6-carboxytetrahydropterin synthase QueD [Leptospiraceae bacterium]MDW8307700.1 6-carboxytetrahydropterin synthase QueD [Leptospiraceae bacterium]